jgi:hypothetical protein
MTSLALIAVRRFLGRERARELDEHRAQMRAVAEEVHRAAASGEQKRDRREISFGRVAHLAREDEIVAPIVGGLAAPRGNVVERHRRGREAITAVRADGAMLLEEPSPGLGVGDASRGMRGELQGAVRCAAFGALLSASPASAMRAGGMLTVRDRVLLRQATSEMMVRRTALEGALLGPFVAIGRVLKMSRQTV